MFGPADLLLVEPGTQIWPFAAAAVPGGPLFFAGQRALYQADEDEGSFALAVDLAGRPIWERRVAGRYVQEAAAAASASGYFLLSGDPAGAVLERLDLSGEPIWQRLLPREWPGVTPWFRLTAGPKGSVLLTILEGRDFALVCFGRHGDLLWARRFPLSAPPAGHVRPRAAEVDDGWIVELPEPTGAILARIDASGAPVWSRKLQADRSVAWLLPVAVDGDEILLLGRKAGPPWLARLGLDGSARGSVVLEGVGDEVFEAAPFAGGAVVLTRPPQQLLALTRLGPDDDLLWSRSYALAGGKLRRDGGYAHPLALMAAPEGLVAAYAASFPDESRPGFYAVPADGHPVCGGDELRPVVRSLPLDLIESTVAFEEMVVGVETYVGASLQPGHAESLDTCQIDRAALIVGVAGEGRVESQPPGIDCPGRCLATFPLGTSVELISHPGAGQRLSSVETVRGAYPTDCTASPFTLNADGHCLFTFVSK